MAQMSYEEFTQMNAASNNTNRNSSQGNHSAPGYLALNDDGDTAIVRFNVSNIDEIVVHSRHTVPVGGRRRSIECLRGFNDPIDVCPLCADGNFRAGFRIYIPLIQYNTESDNTVSIEPCIWDQPARFRETLLSYHMDYGDLRNIIFKITRHGKRGDTGTTYSLIAANPNIYRADTYPADFSSIEGFDIHRYMLLVKSANEMNYYLKNNDFPEVQSIQPAAPAAVSHSSSALDGSVPSTAARRPIPTSQPIRSSYPSETPQAEEAAPKTSGPRRYTY